MDLLDIIRENREHVEATRDLPPVACPHDGTPLEQRGEVRNCPMGDFRWAPDLGSCDVQAEHLEATWQEWSVR